VNPFPPTPSAAPNQFPSTQTSLNAFAAASTPPNPFPSPAVQPPVPATTPANTNPFPVSGAGVGAQFPSGAGGSGGFPSNSPSQVMGAFNAAPPQTQTAVQSTMAPSLSPAGPSSIPTGGPPGSHPGRTAPGGDDLADPFAGISMDSPNAPPGSHASAKFKEGEEVIYIDSSANSWFSKVLQIHFDDAPNLYYTILVVPTGQERQTQENKIHKMTEEFRNKVGPQSSRAQQSPSQHGGGGDPFASFGNLGTGPSGQTPNKAVGPGGAPSPYPSQGAPYGGGQSFVSPGSTTTMPQQPGPPVSNQDARAQQTRPQQGYPPDAYRSPGFAPGGVSSGLPHVGVASGSPPNPYGVPFGAGTAPFGSGAVAQSAHVNMATPMPPQPAGVHPPFGFPGPSAAAVSNGAQAHTQPTFPQASGGQAGQPPAPALGTGIPNPSAPQAPAPAPAPAGNPFDFF